MLVLTPDELIELTGYRQPARQLATLHRLGFHRARRGSAGQVILEREHFRAVSSGVPVAANDPSRPRPRVHRPDAKAANA